MSDARPTKRLYGWEAIAAAGAEPTSYVRTPGGFLVQTQVAGMRLARGEVGEGYYYLDLPADEEGEEDDDASAHHMERVAADLIAQRDAAFSALREAREALNVIAQTATQHAECGSEPSDWLRVSERAEAAFHTANRVVGEQGREGEGPS